MRQAVFTIVLLVALSTQAFGQNMQNTENPGYYRSPGFLAASAGTIYYQGSTSSPGEIRPFVFGMFNLFQSEYGNIALSAGALFSSPAMKTNYATLAGQDISARIKGTHYTAEIGINYITGSDTINFWIGGGYNYSFLESKLKNVKNESGSPSSYSQNYSQNVTGMHYYLGLEYILTKNGKWGMFFLFRVQETDRAQHKLDSNISFADGTTATVNTQKGMCLSNKSYMFGLTYHF